MWRWRLWFHNFILFRNFCLLPNTYLEMNLKCFSILEKMCNNFINYLQYLFKVSPDVFKHKILKWSFFRKKKCISFPNIKLERVLLLKTLPSGHIERHECSPMLLTIHVFLRFIPWHRAHAFVGLVHLSLQVYQQLHGGCLSVKLQKSQFLTPYV